MTVSTASCLAIDFSGSGSESDENGYSAGTLALIVLINHPLVYVALFYIEAPMDYDGLPINVTFDSCRKCVNLTIEDDSVLEKTETFSITLTTNDSQLTLEPDKADVSISDSEGLTNFFMYCMYLKMDLHTLDSATVRFEEPFYKASENMSLIEVCVVVHPLVGFSFTVIIRNGMAILSLKIIFMLLCLFKGIRHILVFDPNDERHCTMDIEFSMDIVTIELERPSDLDPRIKFSKNTTLIIGMSVVVEFLMLRNQTFLLDRALFIYCMQDQKLV